MSGANVVNAISNASSRKPVSNSELGTQVLDEERRIARAKVVTAGPEGITVDVEYREVCPGAVLNRVVLSNSCRTFDVRKAESQEILAAEAAVWGVVGLIGLFARYGENDCNTDACQTWAALGVAMPLVAGGSALGASALNAVSCNDRYEFDTRYEDQWCSDWLSDERDTWTASLLRSAAPLPSVSLGLPPAPLVPVTPSLLSQRYQQLGANHKVGAEPPAVNSLNQPSSVSPPPAGVAIEKRYNGWLVANATLGEHAWSHIVVSSGGRVPRTDLKSIEVEFRDKSNPLSWGRSVVPLSLDYLDRFAADWTCAAMVDPVSAVDTHVTQAIQAGIQSEFDQAEIAVVSALSVLSGRCVDVVSPTVEFACGKLKQQADEAHQVPGSDVLVPVTELCGSGAWGGAAWRMINERMAARAWDDARAILDEHDALLGEIAPTAKARQAVIEAQVLAILTAAKADLAPIVAADGRPVSPHQPQNLNRALESLNSLGSHFNAYAAAFPARSTWLSQQRNLARMAATSAVRMSAQGKTDAYASRREADRLVPMAGDAWRKSVEVAIKKEEEKERAAVAAQERREAAAEAAEQRRAGQEERRGRSNRLPASCYVQFGPSYSRMTCAQLVQDCRRVMPFLSVHDCLSRGVGLAGYCSECY